MPREKFTPFHAQDMPSLDGYVAIVTGGNSGIGYETTLQLALHGARVYIAGRSPERVKTAMAQMKASSAKPLDLHILEMDLQSLKSVKDGAQAFMSQESRLDLLINNAGIMAVPFALTPDGFETTWQTNHLAPFLLTQTLLPLLTSTAAAAPSPTRVRIINVASDAAILPPTPKHLDLARPNLEYVTGSMGPWKRYGHSKIASIVHARALHDRLVPLHITAYAVQPGIVATNLLNSSPGLISLLTKQLVRWNLIPGTLSIPDGATSTLYCAVSPSAVSNSGGYFAPFGRVDGRTGRFFEGEEGVGVAGRLWGESERMLREAGAGE